jgi:hypothetical protein
MCIRVVRRGVVGPAGPGAGGQSLIPLRTMATIVPGEPTAQRVTAVREQLKLLSDYL